MYELHTMAGAYGVRPSSLLHIHKPFVALDFDRAVLGWGRYVEARVEAAPARSRRRVFEALMRGETQQVKGLSDLKAVFGSMMGQAGG